MPTNRAAAFAAFDTAMGNHEPTREITFCAGWLSGLAAFEQVAVEWSRRRNPGWKLAARVIRRAAGQIDGQALARQGDGQLGRSPREHR